jgi:endonuclease YncB( thermonuclease family)
MSLRVKFLSIFLIIIIVFLNGCCLYYNYPDNCSNNTGKIIAGGESETEDTGLVKEVVDGDTIILSGGRTVRLIGINAPEHEMYFFEEARDALKAIVYGREVILEKDVSETDRYGRLLRYVYADGLFVNLEIVNRGFANSYTYPPDVKYTDKFLEAERHARGHELGLWEESRINEVEVEIHYNAAGNDNINLNEEYVIIKNTGDMDLNTYGWTIKDSGTSIYKFNRYNFKRNTSICLFTGSGKDRDGKFYWESFRPIWNNDHDTLYLRDREGLLIGIFNY